VQADKSETDLKTISDLKAEILNWYGGYYWDGRRGVLNPVSILNFLQKKGFKKYWKHEASSRNFLTGFLENYPFKFANDVLKDIPLDNLISRKRGASIPRLSLFRRGI
jgi:hypothetical protein